MVSTIESDEECTYDEVAMWEAWDEDEGEHVTFELLPVEAVERCELKRNVP